MDIKVKVLRFLVALALLFLVLHLGGIFSRLLPIGMPDSIWGLLLLLSLLLLKVVKIQWVLPASRPLLRYMTLFFLPICSGIIDYIPTLEQHLNTLILANFFSTVLSLVLIGWLAQWLFERGEQENE